MAVRIFNGLFLLTVLLAFVRAIPQETGSIDETPSGQYEDPSFLSAALNDTIGQEEVQVDTARRGSGQGCRCVCVVERRPYPS